MKKHLHLGHTYLDKYQVEEEKYFYCIFHWKAISATGVHISKIYMNFEHEEEKEKGKIKKKIKLVKGIAKEYNI